MRPRFVAGLMGLAVLGAAPQHAGAQTVIDRADYARRLRGMWLAQCIANWTGLQTEGQHNAPPFLTDDAWQPPIGTGTLGFVFKDPWWADDDTDIEYVYLHLLDEHRTTLLSPDQIRAGWIAHINQYIWVSNATARALMGDFGLRPAVTGMGHANPNFAMIDAQLTTEFFGALAPAMPWRALAMADLPIRTTAASHAAHASQSFVVLSSLATQVPGGLSGKDRGLWLVDSARPYIPDASKAADIVDFVRAHYLANPDPDDWESTRDAIHQRYQAEPWLLGFMYRGWYESSVNFATAIMALLYSEGDLRKAIRIGTLSGWDSDNPTATIAGLYGLMLGDDGVADQFPGVTLSHRYWIWRTRPTLPDHLPADPQAEDTFELMAERMLPIIDTAVVRAGGSFDPAGGTWVIPHSSVPPLLQNPLQMATQRSANMRARLAGTPPAVTSTASVISGPSWTIGRIANGSESNFTGTELLPGTHDAVVLQAPGTGSSITATVLYAAPQDVAAVRLAKHQLLGPAGTATGFIDALVQLRVGGQWIDPDIASQTEQLDPLVPYQVIDYVLTAPVLADGVRVVGVGVAPLTVTLAELDILSSPEPIACAADCDHSSSLNLFDYICFANTYALALPYADCDGSGSFNIFDYICFGSLFNAGCP